jgi:SAM-dependent methyltransferase
MSTVDPETFARLFTAQYADFDADLPLWKRLARQTGGPILEVGCGDGRVLRSLARDGFEVTGLDSNPAMLARARQSLPSEAGAHVHLVEQDVRSLHIPDRFRLILAPCNTLAALADPDLTRALDRLRSHLQPGGRLAFEVPSPPQGDDLASPDEPLAAFLEPESGNPVQVYADQQTDADGRRTVVTWRYDELRPDGTVQSWSVPATFHLRRPSDYARLLVDAGFAEVSFYGSYRLEAFTPQSPVCIVVGRI